METNNWVFFSFTIGFPRFPPIFPLCPKARQKMYYLGQRPVSNASPSDTFFFFLPTE